MSSRAIKGKCSTLAYKQTVTQILESIKEISLDVLVLIQSCLQLAAVKDGPLREMDFWTICVFLCHLIYKFFYEEHTEYASTRWIISPKYTVVPWILTWTFRRNRKELRTTIWKRLLSTSLPSFPRLCLIYLYSGERQLKGGSWHQI